jgi:hypothetical protein
MQVSKHEDALEHSSGVLNLTRTVVARRGAAYPVVSDCRETCVVDTHKTYLVKQGDQRNDQNEGLLAMIGQQCMPSCPETALTGRRRSVAGGTRQIFAQRREVHSYVMCQ